MSSLIDLRKVSDEEIFEEAIRRIKEHPLKTYQFDYPLAMFADLTVKTDQGEEVKGVFIAQ